MAAVSGISRASQVQSSGTHETSAALTQIESSARQAKKNAQLADERVRRLEVALKDGRQSVEALGQATPIPEQAGDRAPSAFPLSDASSVR